MPRYNPYVKHDAYKHERHAKLTIHNNLECELRITRRVGRQLDTRYYAISLERAGLVLEKMCTVGTVYPYVESMVLDLQSHDTGVWLPCTFATCTFIV